MDDKEFYRREEDLEDLGAQHAHEGDLYPYRAAEYSEHWEREAYKRGFGTARQEMREKDKVDQYLELPVDENFELLHLGTTPDAKIVGIVDRNHQKWKVLAILQSGNELDPDYEVVVQSMFGEEKRAPITTAQVEGIKRMTDHRTWVNVVEGAERLNHAINKEKKR